MVVLRRGLARNGGSLVVMDEILEPKEVAKLLKVNHRTVVRWAEQGKLPGFKLGDLWRFRREAIEEHIRQLEKGMATFTGASPEDEKTTSKDDSDTLPSDSNNQDKADKS
jgi:excisionase family DNA binding protein